MDGTASITLDDVEVTAPANMRRSTDDTVTITVEGKEWSGWQRVTVTRGLDTVPAVFDLQVTEKFPHTGDISIRPGVPCVVKIGGEPVITGYVDRYTAAISPNDHTVRITGRSKSADLVDCAAYFGAPNAAPEDEGYITQGGTTKSIVSALAQPYDVGVQSTAGDGKQIKLFAIIFGETPWEIIDRITRYSEMIVYDMPDGSLMLSQAGGGGSMSSGFVLGKNIESAEVMFSMDQRFSVYEGFAISTGVFEQGGPSGGRGQIPKAVEHDEAVPRWRKRIIVSEQAAPEEHLIEARTRWEMNRRKGRSMAVNVTADSWRDTGGKLWAPNAMAPISLPVLKLKNETWCIGQIVFVRDEQGQHAQLTLMPKDAFLAEPSVYQALPPEQGSSPNNPTARQEDGTLPRSVTTEAIVTKGGT